MLGGLIMNWIMLVIAFIFGAILMFVMFCIGHAAKLEEPVNKVHFYVARDKNGRLYLYLCKPIREEYLFQSCQNKHGSCLARDSELAIYGLNENDYKDLKWEDEPLEVFINMED